MICTQFLKITKKEIHYYMPDLKDYFFTEQFRKERGRFGFEVPADVTCKQAIPSFPKDNKLFKKQKLSEFSTTKPALQQILKRLI